jgi:hypothetical protein
VCMAIAALTVRLGLSISVGQACLCVPAWVGGSGAVGSGTVCLDSSMAGAWPSPAKAIMQRADSDMCTESRLLTNRNTSCSEVLGAEPTRGCPGLQRSCLRFSREHLESRTRMDVDEAPALGSERLDKSASVHVPPVNRWTCKVYRTACS